jgi:hypothetical protein
VDEEFQEAIVRVSRKREESGVGRLAAGAVGAVE